MDEDDDIPESIPENENNRVTFIYPCATSKFSVPDDDQQIIMYIFGPISKNSVQDMVKKLEFTDVVFGSFRGETILEKIKAYRFNQANIYGWYGTETILSKKPLLIHPNQYIENKKMVRCDLSWTNKLPSNFNRNSWWYLFFSKNSSINTRINSLFSLWSYHTLPLLIFSLVFDFQIFVFILFLVPHIYYVVKRFELLPYMIINLIFPVTILEWFYENIFFWKIKSQPFFRLNNLELPVGSPNGSPKHGHEFVDEDKTISKK